MTIAVGDIVAIKNDVAEIPLADGGVLVAGHSYEVTAENLAVLTQAEVDDLIATSTVVTAL